MKTLNLTLNQSMYEELIDTFMPSIDMRQHLKRIKLVPEKIMELMIAAPVGLDIKRDWFRKLAVIEEIVDDGYPEDIDIEIYKFADVAKEFDKAIDALAEKGTCQFTIESCWYDVDIKECKSYLLGVADSYEYAKLIIQQEIWEEEEEDSDSAERSPRWYEVKKWVKRKAHGIYEQLNTYYAIAGDTPILFEESHIVISMKRLNVNFSVFQFANSIMLQLPLPYKPGDIVAIDTWPLGPTQPAIIYNIADNGRIVELITKNYQGKWFNGSLFSGSFGRWKGQFDWISPLYNIKKWQEPLGEDDEVYKTIISFVKGNAGNGEKLSKALDEIEISDLTSPDVIMYIKGLG
ncbi:hypothetical protein [Pseudobutyrivibrio sp. MD2005]|uniref:hypothetical protein n=1 Tax=Pseudobutyrivibrio sp. MD2005 TaxID=1410616 RepID=UPI000487C6BE|nr:hypothetical protein [Pseudobutyrivibrio sp. MD2005]